MDNNDTDLAVQETLPEEPQEGSETPAEDTDSQPELSDTEDEENPEDQESEPSGEDAWTREEILKKYKSIQPDYTKKAQALKDVEREKNALAEKNAQVQRMFNDVLSDPQKLDAYRKLYAPKGSVAADEPMPELNTTEDLRNWVKGLLEKQAQELKVEFNKERVNDKYQSQVEQRWNKAVESLKEDPVFSNPRFQEIIIGMVTKNADKYRSDLQTGRLKEIDVLKSGISEFKEILKPMLEKAKTDGAVLTEKKKRASTVQPAKGGVATSPSRQLTRDEIISQVKQELGE